MGDNSQCANGAYVQCSTFLLSAKLVYSTPTKQNGVSSTFERGLRAMNYVRYVQVFHKIKEFKM